MADHFPFALEISKLVANVFIEDSLLFGPPPLKIEEISSESFFLLNWDCYSKSLLLLYLLY